MFLTFVWLPVPVFRLHSLFHTFFTTFDWYVRLQFRVPFLLTTFLRLCISQLYFTWVIFRFQFLFTALVRLIIAQILLRLLFRFYFLWTSNYGGFVGLILFLLQALFPKFLKIVSVRICWLSRFCNLITHILLQILMQLLWNFRFVHLTHHLCIGILLHILI